jgi:hypothetical protein
MSGRMEILYCRRNGWIEDAGDEEEDAGDEVPASDRSVRLDHNAPEYHKASDALARTIEAVRGNNEYRATDPEDRWGRNLRAMRGQNLAQPRCSQAAAKRKRQAYPEGTFKAPRAMPWRPSGRAYRSPQ